jgi:hypothetical protein
MEDQSVDNRKIFPNHGPLTPLENIIIIFAFLFCTFFFIINGYESNLQAYFTPEQIQLALIINFGMIVVFVFIFGYMTLKVTFKDIKTE